MSEVIIPAEKADLQVVVGDDGHVWLGFFDANARLAVFDISKATDRVSENPCAEAFDNRVVALKSWVEERRKQAAEMPG